MFVNKDSIIINGISMGQYLLSAKYEYNKLWGTDTGRNLAGVMTGTLVGIFPKLILTFKSMTKAEMNELNQLIDSMLHWALIGACVMLIGGSIWLTLALRALG